MAKAYARLGTSGTAAFGGFLDNKEKDPTLVGDKRWLRFSEITLNVGIVSAAIRYYLNVVSQVNWTCIPKDDSQAAKDLAQRVLDTIHNMDTPWSRVIKNAAMYRLTGFNIQEWVAKKNADGWIGLQDIEPRPNHTIWRWNLDENSGDVLGVWQLNPWNFQEVYLPAYKMIYVVDDAISDSPEGIGLLRHIAPHANKLQSYEKMEATGFQTDLRGVPVVKAPLMALDDMEKREVITNSEKEKILEGVVSFIDNHIRGPATGLLLDSQAYRNEDAVAAVSDQPHWAVDLLAVDTKLFNDLGKAIDRKTYDIARILSCEHLLLGSSSQGSYAMSKDKTKSFFLNADGSLTDVADVHGKRIVDILWKLNGLDDALKPELRPESIRFRDAGEMTKAIKDLALAGAKILPDDPAVLDVRDVLGLSRPSAEQMAEAKDQAILANKPPPPPTSNPNIPPDSGAP